MCFQYGLEHVCVGDLLRDEIEAGTDAGARAKTYMNQGALVPNEIVVEMVKHSLASSKAKTNGWLLDGYPRSLEQAMAIEEEHIRPDIFLLLKVPHHWKLMRSCLRCRTMHWWNVSSDGEWIQKLERFTI